MKFLAIILSFYFLGLNFVPCEDEAAPQQSTAEFEQLDRGEQHSQGEADDCTPFCQCHCCHVHVVNISADSFEVLEPSISTLIVKNGENSGEDIPNYHFQPPRV